MARTTVIAMLLAGLGACASPSAPEPPGPPPPPPPAPPPPAPSTSASTITSGELSLVANGASTATITVTLRDSSGAAIQHSAGVVTIRGTAGTLSPVTDHGNGTYSAIDQATTILGVDTVTASLGGVLLDHRVTIPFVAGPPALASWFPNNTFVPADGISTATVSLTLEDAEFHPATPTPGSVTMSTTKGTLSPVTCVPGGCSANLTSTTFDEIAVVTARLDGQPLGPALSIHFDHRQWVVKASLSTPRMSLGVAALNGVIYAVGGTSNLSSNSVWNFNRMDWVSQVEAYDPIANHWTARAAMPTARTDLAVGVVGGMIYAVGGHNTVDQSAVEAYNPLTDTWSARTPMPTARAGLGVGVANGILYAIGGRMLTPGSTYQLPGPAPHPAGPSGQAPGITFSDVPGDGATNVAEAYDPATNTWRTIRPMPTPRSHVGVGVIGGIVYVVGGQSGDDHLPVVEAYDPATDQWTTRAPLPYPVGALSVVAMGGKLYAIGGVGGYEGTSDVEVYDPAADTWTVLPPMSNARFATGAAFVNGVIYAIGGGCYDVMYSLVEALTP